MTAHYPVMQGNGPQSPSLALPGEILDQFGQPCARVEAPPEAREEVRVRFPADLPGVQLWTARSSDRLYTVFHTTYAFCSAERMTGSQSWRYRRRTYRANLAASMLMEPGEVHVTMESAPADFHVLLVDPEVIEREFDGDERLRGRHFREAQIDDPRLVARFVRVWEAIERQGGCELERQHHLRRYLSLVFERAGEAPPRMGASGCEQAVRRARELLQDRYADKLTLDTIAREAGLSKFHLERQFARRMGLPLHQYLRKVRVARAQTLLAQGVRPAQVAGLAGFSDQSHLTRVFREELSFTPRQYFDAANPSRVPDIIDPG